MTQKYKPIYISQNEHKSSVNRNPKKIIFQNKLSRNVHLTEQNTLKQEIRCLSDTKFAKNRFCRIIRCLFGVFFNN